MAVRTDFPRRIRRIDHTWIALADGTRLGARILSLSQARRDYLREVDKCQVLT